MTLKWIPRFQFSVRTSLFAFTFRPGPIQHPLRRLYSRGCRKVGLGYRFHVESEIDNAQRITLKKRILKFQRTFKLV
jgi:hypothetical protein